jgi:pyruvate,water dikinase
MHARNVQLVLAESDGPTRSDAETCGTAVSHRGWTLLHGRGVSPGTATGSVRVLASPDEGDEPRRGEVLVAPMNGPEWVPAMSRAVALITWGGGSPHRDAAIIARAFAVPCVILPRPACWALHDGSVVTVDGDHGLVFAGAIGEVGAAGTLRTRLPKQRAYWGRRSVHATARGRRCR